jgi:ParB family transcriptional regulator, chromosome partitioning protein
VCSSDLSDEWYTPAWLIEKVRSFMGSIDLDPASCAKAQEVVKAKTYYTKEDNGLVKPWKGNVWCNPPYSKECMINFVKKAIEEQFNCNQMIILTLGVFDSEWSQLLLNNAKSLILMNKRLCFYNEKTGTHSNRPFQGSAIYYFNNEYGEANNNFKNHFSDIGYCIKLRD